MLADGNSYREPFLPGNTAYTPAPMMTIANPGQVVAGRYANNITNTTAAPKM